MPSRASLLFLSMSDPARLLDLLTTAEGRKAVAALWTGAGILFLVVLVVLSQQTKGNGWWLVAWAGLGWSLSLLIVAIAVMTAGNGHLWLLYTIAPFSLLIYGICAVAMLHPFGVIVFFTLFPYYLGMVVAITGAMWICKNERWRQRYPKVGITADSLPKVGEWRVVSVGRIGLCGAVVAGAFSVPFVGTAEDRAIAGWFIVVGLCFCAGILRLESTLGAILGLPLVAEDGVTQKWRSTSVGRFAFIVPPQAFESFLPPRLSPATSAEAWIALLEDGTVGTHTTGQIARLASETLREFLLVLSLQRGGGDALALLRPRLSARFQLIATAYQHLAQVGAVPYALQQWLTTLDDAIPPLKEVYPTLVMDLERVRSLLLATRLTGDEMEQNSRALERLERIAASYRRAGEITASGWLFALVVHSRQHQAALKRWLE